MTKVEIELYGSDEKEIYELKQYAIEMGDNVLVLVLRFKGRTIIYKFFTDETARSYKYIEQIIRQELSKSNAYLYEFTVRNYVTVGNVQLTGQRIDTII